MTRHEKDLINQLLARRAQWERLYTSDYIRRFFTLYSGEMEAMLVLARDSARRLAVKTK
jgi:hypothetical protein